MSLPEIPPNCEFFWTHSKHGDGYQWVTLGTTQICLEPDSTGYQPSAAEKKIIACVAAQFLRIEAADLMQKSYDARRTDGMELRQQALSAEKSVQDWLRWGGLIN